MLETEHDVEAAEDMKGVFPPAGARLFVITGEAVTSRSRSSPILMGLLSAQCNDFTKVMIAAGRARQHHQQFKG